MCTWRKEIKHIRKSKQQCLQMCSPSIDTEDLLHFYLCHFLMLSGFCHNDVWFLSCKRNLTLPPECLLLHHIPFSHLSLQSFLYLLDPSFPHLNKRHSVMPLMFNNFVISTPALHLNSAFSSPSFPAQFLDSSLQTSLHQIFLLSKILFSSNSQLSSKCFLQTCLKLNSLKITIFWLKLNGVFSVINFLNSQTHVTHC